MENTVIPTINSIPIEEIKKENSGMPLNFIGMKNFVINSGIAQMFVINAEIPNCSGLTATFMIFARKIRKKPIIIIHPDINNRFFKLKNLGTFFS